MAELPSIRDGVFYLGLASILAGLLGGGVKALGAELPVLSTVRRQVAVGIFGVMLVVSAGAVTWATGWTAASTERLVLEEFRTENQRLLKAIDELKVHRQKLMTDRPILLAAGEAAFIDAKRADIEMHRFEKAGDQTRAADALERKSGLEKAAIQSGIRANSLRDELEMVDKDLTRLQEQQAGLILRLGAQASPK